MEVREVYIRQRYEALRKRLLRLISGYGGENCQKVSKYQAVKARLGKVDISLNECFAGRKDEGNFFFSLDDSRVSA